MTQLGFQTVQQKLEALLSNTRRYAVREQTRQALAILGPALRDDLGLTRHRQLISFQNDKHQKHSFD
ncbi:hypothetical protein [Rhizobium rosettiformans]|uniref:hypothetical protein n=1 Tax=Rhizobium rosettiformans TaxID=1368430 RepID=UPI001933263A|nr:hypothetical protein [Rhizobium rosettiformans]